MSNKKYAVTIPSGWLCTHLMENCDEVATENQYVYQCKLMLELNVGIDADVFMGGYSLDITEDGHAVDDELYHHIELVLMTVPPIYIVKRED